ncbi:hypothetical protein [Halobaculum sp. MBLA0143]|uniref:hypothetical protein n=1 Tax=Halobaculum sp. MBLA0143 TaxID=3079933 RepID=UPI0035234A61
MSSLFQNPAVRYGVPITNALVVAAVAVVFLDGLARNVAFAIAVVEAVVVPQVLARAAQ